MSTQDFVLLGHDRVTTPILVSYPAVYVPLFSLGLYPALWLLLTWKGWEYEPRDPSEHFESISQMLLVLSFLSCYARVDLWYILSVTGGCIVYMLLNTLAEFQVNTKSFADWPSSLFVTLGILGTTYALIYVYQLYQWFPSRLFFHSLGVLGAVILWMGFGIAAYQRVTDKIHLHHRPIFAALAFLMSHPCVLCRLTQASCIGIVIHSFVAYKSTAILSNT